MLKHFKENKLGRDFVVGDLHGCYKLLMARMEEVGFDREKDRLFAVGDLVDRGEENMECLRLLKEPWFFSVLGNHEDMMLEGGMNWARNGGGWVTPGTKGEFLELCKVVRGLPLMIEVDVMVDGVLNRIGIVHGDPPDDWDHGEVDKEEMIWGRRRISRASFRGSKPEDVVGVDGVVVGHTPLKEVLAIGNVLYIDTGACFGDKFVVGGKVDRGYLTVIELKDVPRLLKERNFENAIALKKAT